MYDLWKDKHISRPSEYWNMGMGDKIVLKAFRDYDIEEKNRERKEMSRNKTPVFPVIVV